MTDKAPQHLDVTTMLEKLDARSLRNYREELIDKIMSEQQIVSSSWSMIDSPFAQEHQKDDHDMLRDEFRALVANSVCLPQSVEGIRFLEQWYDARIAKLKHLAEVTIAGTTLAMRPPGQPEEHRDVTLNEDMARGMRVGLSLALSMFDKFPLSLTCSDDE